MNIYIFGEIDESTVNSIYAQIIEDYAAGEDVNIVFDTPGGYVECAYYIIEMLNELKTSGSKLIARNIGDVMSAATIIWLTCDQRIWDDSAGDFLIHNPFVEEVTGDAATMIEVGSELIRLEEEFKSIYSNISNADENVFAEIMQKNEPMSLYELEKYHFCTHKVVNKRKYNKA